MIVGLLVTASSFEALPGLGMYLSRPLAFFALNSTRVLVGARRRGISRSSSDVSDFAARAGLD